MASEPPVVAIEGTVVEVNCKASIAVSNAMSIASVRVSTALPEVSTQMSAQVIYATREIVYLIIEVVDVTIDVLDVAFNLVDVYVRHLHFKLLVLESDVATAVNVLD